MPPREAYKQNNLIKTCKEQQKPNLENGFTYKNYLRLPLLPGIAQLPSTLMELNISTALSSHMHSHEALRKPSGELTDKQGVLTESLLGSHEKTTPKSNAYRRQTPCVPHLLSVVLRQHVAALHQSFSFAWLSSAQKETKGTKML